MYIPPAFAEQDLKTLHDFIDHYSFGTLVSQQGDRPFASHLPFLLERNRGSNGALVGHFARANSQWQNLTEQNVLAVFSGPHAYISPTWYESDHVVPTWNYVAVHVYGRVELCEDRAGLFQIVEDLVVKHEQSMNRPWSLGQRETFTDRLLVQIVGFRLEIEVIEGKWKLNQNHPVERRHKVIRALEEQGTSNSLGVASLMKQTLRACESER